MMSGITEEGALPCFSTRSSTVAGSRRLECSRSSDSFICSIEPTDNCCECPNLTFPNAIQVPTEAGVIAVPGVAGGTAWSPGAYHPGTGLVYTVAVHLPVRLSFRPNTIWQSRKPFHGGVPEHAPGGREEGHGRVVALDPFTGKVEWSYRTRQPIQSGLLTTASKLVFAGQAEGSFDAWHASTGRHLWSHKTPAGINAAPATYRINGRQHIVVAAGGSFGIRLLGFEAPLGDAIVAFALPSVGD